MDVSQCQTGDRGIFNTCDVPCNPNEGVVLAQFELPLGNRNHRFRWRLVPNGVQNAVAKALNRVRSSSP